MIPISLHLWVAGGCLRPGGHWVTWESKWAHLSTLRTSNPWPKMSPYSANLIRTHFLRRSHAGLTLRPRVVRLATRWGLYFGRGTRYIDCLSLMNPVHHLEIMASGNPEWNPSPRNTEMTVNQVLWASAASTECVSSPSASCTIPKAKVKALKVEGGKDDTLTWWFIWPDPSLPRTSSLFISIIHKHKSIRCASFSFFNRIGNKKWGEMRLATFHLILFFFLILTGRSPTRT